MRKAAWPDINLSPQVLISCELPDQGCHGGDARTAYEWIHSTTLLIKHALLIKLMDTVMALTVQQPLNAKIVFLEEDAGHNKELKYTVLINLEMLKVSKI